MRLRYLFHPLFAAHNSDVGPGLQRQSLPYLNAEIGHICIRLDRAENNLPDRSRSTGKEHPLHQTPNLFAGEVLRIPIVRFAVEPNPRQRSFLRP
jgi:hypothetical protein